MSSEVTAPSPNPDFWTQVAVGEEFDESIRERANEQYFHRKFAYRQVEALAYVCEHPGISADSIVGTIAEFYGLNPESYNKAIKALQDKELIVDDGDGSIAPGSDAWVVLSMLQEDPSKISQRRREKQDLGKLYEIMQYIDSNTDGASGGWLYALGSGKSVYERIGANVSLEHLNVMRYVSKLRRLGYVELHKDGEHQGALVVGVRLSETGSKNLAAQANLDVLLETDEIDEIEELESLQETCVELARMVGNTAVRTTIDHLRQLNEASGYKNVDIEKQLTFTIKAIEQLRLEVRRIRLRRQYKT